MYVYVFVNNVETRFHFTFYFLESNPHPSPPFTTQTFCIIYNVITIMTFVLLIRNGRLEVVQFLVNGNHSDPNAVNKDGVTALLIAVW